MGTQPGQSESHIQQEKGKDRVVDAPPGGLPARGLRNGCLRRQQDDRKGRPGDHAEPGQHPARVQAQEPEEGQAQHHVQWERYPSPVGQGNEKRHQQEKYEAVLLADIERQEFEVGIQSRRALRKADHVAQQAKWPVGLRPKARPDRSPAPRS